ncbi:MAG: omcB 2 [Planctomycetaceae bacterium]|nr:omcB 2 [Planctomycetaceae bacterium]
MRKIWWLPVICIAACVPQALIAVDSQDSTPTKSPSSGRSRLLIFSRKKTPPPEADVDQADDLPRPASARLSKDDTADDAKPLRRLPSGDTGTISPRSGLSRAGQTQTGTKAGTSRVSESAETGSDLAAEDSSSIEDEDIRKMFEDETAAAKTPAKRPVTATRPAAPRTENVSSETARRAAVSDDESAETETRKSARYRELLGTSPAADRAAAPAKKKIVPVSTESTGKPELEVNPFEPSERPTKVVNAGWEEEQGAQSVRRVKPASATAAAKPSVTPKTDKTETAEKADKSSVVTAPSTRVVPVKPVSVVRNAGPSQPKDMAKVLEIGKPGAKSPVTKDAFEVTATRPNMVNTSAISTSNSNTHSPQVDVQWEPRGEVTLGQECKCALVVHNSGKVAACDVIVEANFPESVRLVNAKPLPKEATSRLEWQFGSLAAGEKKVIELMIVPTKRGELAASAQVRFTGTAATSFQVSEPLLTTVVKMAEEIHLGEPASATVTVSNPGTGTAQNVMVQAILPAGLSSTSGKEILTELGPIGAGETRTMRLALIATAGGDQVLKVIAKSSTAELEHTATAKIVVLAPSLALKATGPSLRYVNRAAKYLLTVTNNSNASTDNVRISQKVHSGFEFARADHGGQWDSQGRTVSWYLGHLDAGQSMAVELELMPKETGEFQQQFRVVGDSGAQATAEVATRVEGAASLVMEVKDGDDPVEVGTETMFEVRVRNDGSKSAHKVAISLELPPDVELVNVDGPTKHLFESGMLIFKPLAELAAGDSATFKVFIKATAAGTTKLRARLTSESIQKPLIVEEATQFYQE